MEAKQILQNQNDYCCHTECVMDCEDCYVGQISEKLVQYIRLEEQGLLIRLPCKVGDTLYFVNIWSDPPMIEEHIVTSIRVLGNNEFILYFTVDYREEFLHYMPGETQNVFLNREEAEKRLEESKIKGY